MKIGKLDEYSVKARVFPAFLVLLPLGICAAQFVGFGSAIVAAFSAFGGAALLSFVLAQWSRDAGKLKEQTLYHRWGGIPTTTYLRHRNQRVGATVRTRVHQRLQRLVPDLILPSLIAEAENPEEADERYKAATKVLIQRTRDKEQYSVLFQELIDYGFRRNTWGLKSSAIASLIFVMILDALFIGLRFNLVFNSITMIVFAACLAIWILFVTPDWVYRAAQSYAERLFDTLDEKIELDDPMPKLIANP
jgi:hypothetical protein